MILRFYVLRFTFEENSGTEYLVESSFTLYPLPFPCQTCPLISL